MGLTDWYSLYYRDKGIDREKGIDMKIVAGLGCVDDYIRFVKAGADEFFCGYVPYQWTKKYGVMLPLNRREVLYYNVQIGSLEELRILKKMMDKYQVPVKITFNSLFYLEEQYGLIKELIYECMEAGFDTFIIADIALLLFLRKEKLDCKIHLSGEAAEVNHLMMDVMNQFQIKRYIFHRKNTIEDMKNCIKRNPVKGLEYEAFALNEWCHYTGGFCNSLHCDELVHLCKVPYQMAKVRNQGNRFNGLIEQWQQEAENSEEYSEDADYEEAVGCHENGAYDHERIRHEQNVASNHEKIEKEQNVEFDHERIGHEQNQDVEEDNWRNHYLTGSTGCGLCALWKLKRAGVTHLKLVGRGNYADYMEEDIRQLRHAIQLAERCENNEEYVKEMKKALFPNGCSGICYYRDE